MLWVLNMFWILDTLKNHAPTNHLDLSTQNIMFNLMKVISSVNILLNKAIYLNTLYLDTIFSNLDMKYTPGRVAQSVTCLATDACLTTDPGVASSIPARYHTFVEIDHEIISTVVLLPSADLFKKGCCQLQAKVCAQITG